MKNRTRALALTAILAAVMLVFGFTPIGYIPTPFGIVITLMCLPVIIGTLMLGLKAGISLGALFVITSFLKIPSDVFGPTLLAENAFGVALMIIVPRVLIPVVSHFVYRAMRTKSELINVSVASVAGSMTNTVLYLALLYAFFADIVAREIMLSAAFVNGLLEAVVAAAACAPIVRALKKSMPKLNENQNHKENTAA